MKNKIILSLSVMTLLSLGAQAQSFEAIGYKAASMGGAGVASSKNAMASYYNPALLAKPDRDVEIAVGVGVGVVDNGALESVNKLNDAGFSALIDKANNNVADLTLADVATLSKSRDIVIGMNGEGVLATPDAYVSAQVGSFSVGVFGSVETAGIAIADPAHNKLIFDDTANSGLYVDIEDLSNITITQGEYENTSLEYAVNNNLTYLRVDTLTLIEVPLSYGHAFDTGVGSLSVGGSLKFMQGTSYAGDVNVDTDSGNIEDILKDSEKKSSDIGIDVGLLYEPTFAEGLRVGLVGKNLNTPSFDRQIGGSIDIDPMIRMGVAYNIFESLEVAFDYDITKNDTLLASSIDTYQTQYLGGGVNWHPVTWASLRAGLMENQASSYEGLIYTAGLAIGPEALQLDISAQMSSEENEVDGDTYPRAARVNIALISRW